MLLAKCGALTAVPERYNPQRLCQINLRIMLHK